MRDSSLLPQLNSILPPSGLLPGVKWFKTDVSGLPIYHLQGSSCSWTAWPLKLEQRGGPKTSISKHLTPSTNLEHGKNTKNTIKYNFAQNSYSYLWFKWNCVYLEIVKRLEKRAGWSRADAKFSNFYLLFAVTGQLTHVFSLLFWRCCSCVKTNAHSIRLDFSHLVLGAVVN